MIEKAIPRLFVLTILSGMVLSGCNVYADYFTLEGQYYNKFGTVYGIDKPCSVEPEGEQVLPSLTLLDYYQAGEIICGIKSLSKEDKYHVLKPYETCSIEIRINDSEFNIEEVAPITLKVKKLDKNKIEVIKNDGEPQEYTKCYALRQANKN